RMIQTPQVFSAEVLRKAYEQPFSATFTDDASVVEAAGHKITLIEGERENIKITTPSDMVIAEAIIAQNQNDTHL
ncbi:MAG: 2-C-methyl-D-erythritol 4-phosphate cytidylyltransferase, partial [Alistipes sp.]|nr:2-C-methyl-D-erythritol 4-phosphate cytidylyltransferase [Alistipes sp.]